MRVGACKGIFASHGAQIGREALIYGRLSHDAMVTQRGCYRHGCVTYIVKKNIYIGALPQRGAPVLIRLMPGHGRTCRTLFFRLFYVVLFYFYFFMPAGKADLSLNDKRPLIGHFQKVVCNRDISLYGRYHAHF